MAFFNTEDGVWMTEFGLYASPVAPFLQSGPPPVALQQSGRKPPES